MADDTTRKNSILLVVTPEERRADPGDNAGDSPYFVVSPGAPICGRGFDRIIVSDGAREALEGKQPLDISCPHRALALTELWVREKDWWDSVVMTRLYPNATITNGPEFK